MNPWQLLTEFLNPYLFRYMRRREFRDVMFYGVHPDRLEYQLEHEQITIALLDASGAPGGGAQAITAFRALIARTPDLPEHLLFSQEDHLLAIVIYGTSAERRRIVPGLVQEFDTKLARSVGEPAIVYAVASFLEAVFAVKRFNVAKDGILRTSSHSFAPDLAPMLYRIAERRLQLDQLQESLACLAQSALGKKWLGWEELPPLPELEQIPALVRRCIPFTSVKQIATTPMAVRYAYLSGLTERIVLEDLHELFVATNRAYQLDEIVEGRERYWDLCALHAVICADRILNGNEFVDIFYDPN